MNNKQTTEQKVRLGNGKKRKDSWMTASICITDALNHSYEYNGKKYVNVNINIADQPNQYGKDVTITLNDYKKDNQQKVVTSSKVVIAPDEDFTF
jgi:hypothetical protein